MANTTPAYYNLLDHLQMLGVVESGSPTDPDPTLDDLLTVDPSGAKGFDQNFYFDLRLAAVAEDTNIDPSTNSLVVFPKIKMFLDYLFACNIVGKQDVANVCEDPARIEKWFELTAAMNEDFGGHRLRDLFLDATIEYKAAYPGAGIETSSMELSPELLGKSCASEAGPAINSLGSILDKELERVAFRLNNPELTESGDRIKAMHQKVLKTVDREQLCSLQVESLIRKDELTNAIGLLPEDRKQTPEVIDFVKCMDDQLAAANDIAEAYDKAVEAGGESDIEQHRPLLDADTKKFLRIGGLVAVAAVTLVCMACILRGAAD